MSRLSFLKRSALAVMLLAQASPLFAEPARKPNIVLILTDNLGYGEIGAYGGGATRGAPTPRIDSLARDGLKLTNFNVETLCSPSRSALLTGRFAIRSGTTAVEYGPDAGLVGWEITLAEMLKDVGYTSGLFGKWHVGSRIGRYPTDQGFDEWYGIPRSSESTAWFGTPGYDPKLVPPDHVMESHRAGEATEVAVYDKEMRARLDGEITKHSIDFIKRRAKSGKPFFAFVSLTAGHMPVIASPEWKGKTGNGPWADVLAQLDNQVGQIIDTVKSAGIEQDTIFIFTSDNGPEGMYTPSQTGDRGWAGPWRGGMGTAMEGGLRVPFLIRWPHNVHAGSESNEMVHLVDLFPTFAKIAGATLPSDRAIDGHDQSNFFLGKQTTSNRDYFPIFDADAKLIGEKWKDWKVQYSRKEFFSSTPVEGLFIYNLLWDPTEASPLGPEYFWVLNAVGAQFGEFQKSLSKYPLIKPSSADPYVPPQFREGIGER